jgi:formylglycine-generating enzyme required for sulfatase activity
MCYTPNKITDLPRDRCMRAVFISYRRDDTEGQAGRLFKDLVKVFGEQSVFMDVAGIEPGRDFRRAIDEHVASCCVLLALIGKNWLDARDEGGRRRLDDPLDFVRLETAAALKRDIPVVPVLVRGASMPQADQLPEDLANLVFRNAIELTHARWDSDVTVLCKALRKHIFPPIFQITRGRVAAIGIAMIIISVGVGAYFLNFQSAQIKPVTRLPEPPKVPGVKEMVLVPGGPFEMGSTEEEVEAAYQLARQYSPEVNKVWYEPEQPRHWIRVDAFYMDKYEVTLEEYQIFMREREKPYQELPDWTSKYANIPKHPVVGVSWEDAVGYCRWAGKRLPTEAQWEKAARATDGRWYPWGSESVDGKRANYCDAKCEYSWKDKNHDDGYRYLSPVGAYELGKSFYGIYDLAGNVWEWVQDWYDAEYYSKSPERNPINDKEAQYRVVRGGSWDSDPSFLRASYRNWQEPNSRTHSVGFRCVLPATPEH